MDEISIRIENIPVEANPISINDGDDDYDIFEPMQLSLSAPRKQYPPGTQKNYNSFSSRNPITEKGKELEYPEGAGGGKGEPGVPPTPRNNSPITISDNSSSDSDSQDEELRIIRKDRIRNQIQNQFVKKNFGQIEDSLAKYYQCDAKSYDKLDILITFMKGQKTLFMQSNFITQKKVYMMMLPVLFFSAAMAIFAPIIQEYSWSGGLISGLNVIVTFLVSMMNYMRYESRADKYLQLANHFDRMEMSLEMASNKIAYIEDKGEKNALVLNKLKEIEINMNELKEIYDILLPPEIILRFPIICNINIFSLIKKMESYRRVLIYKFKDVKNEIGYIIHKWKTDKGEVVLGEQQKEKDRLLFLYEIKEKIKGELLEFVNIYQYVDELFSKEIKVSGDVRWYFCSSARRIKKEDVHPVLQRYFAFIL